MFKRKEFKRERFQRETDKEIYFKRKKERNGEKGRSIRCGEHARGGESQPQPLSSLCRAGAAPTAVHALSSREHLELLRAQFAVQNRSFSSIFFLISLRSVAVRFRSADLLSQISSETMFGFALVLALALAVAAQEEVIDRLGFVFASRPILSSLHDAEF